MKGISLMESDCSCGSSMRMSGISRVATGDNPLIFEIIGVRMLRRS